MILIKRFLTIILMTSLLFVSACSKTDNIPMASNQPERDPTKTVGQGAIDNGVKKDELPAGEDELLAKIRLGDFAESRGIHQLLVDDLVWVEDEDEPNGYRLFNENEEWLSYDLDKECEITLVYHGEDYIPDGEKVSIGELATELMDREDMDWYLLAQVVLDDNRIVEIAEVYTP